MVPKSIKLSNESPVENENRKLSKTFPSLISLIQLLRLRLYVVFSLRMPFKLMDNTLPLILNFAGSLVRGEIQKFSPHMFAAIFSSKIKVITSS